MSNVLFLTSQYTGAAAANGICTRNIVQALKEKGHQVSVVCYQNDVQEEDVYMIPAQKAGGNDRLLSKLGKAIRSYFCPVMDENIHKLFCETALSLCENKKIDAVVYVYFPLETVMVMEDVKKRFPNITNIVYELDSVGDGIFAASKRNNLAVYNYEKWCIQNYRYADKVVIMESHEEYWRRKFGAEHGDKLQIADIPVLTPRTLPENVEPDHSVVSFLYGGLLGQKYRSPAHLLSVLDAYSKQEKITADFFSKGDCEDQIAAYEARNSSFHRRGYVPEAVLEEALAKADVLVSIGNRISRSVPSKLITYLSYGRPVIHLASQREDVCIGYLERYPLGLVLYEMDSVDENVKKLSRFVEEVRGKTVQFDTISETLILNTPEYSAELILKIISDLQRGG